MKNNSGYLVLFLTSLLLFTIMPGSAKAQLDLDNLSEKKTKSTEVITKEYYFNYIREQIISGESDKHITLGILADRNQVPDKYVKYFKDFGGQKLASEKEVIKDILKHDYKMSLPDGCRAEGVSCYEMVFTRLGRVMNDLGTFYYRTINRGHLGESEKKRLLHDLEGLKGWVTKNKRRWGDIDHLPRIMGFIDDYNELLASAFKDAKSAKRVKIKELEKEKEKERALRNQKEREQIADQREQEIQRENERLMAEQIRREERKRKTASIIEYVIKNQPKLEKESRSFRKDVSGVWRLNREVLKIDLYDANRTIMIGNTKPFSVQIAEYDKDNHKITIYVLTDGKLSNDKDGVLLGYIIEMVSTGGKEFRIMVSVTDGIESVPIGMAGFVRDIRR